MSDKSPLKKRANPEGGAKDALEGATKRQRISEKDSKTKKVVDDDDSQDFDADAQSGDDSFDDDFDAEESAPGEGEDDFDLEKYKKWREENGADDEGAEGGEDEMIEGEEGEADNSDDYGSEGSK
jgi:hypothetical protein